MRRREAQNFAGLRKSAPVNCFNLLQFARVSAPAFFRGWISNRYRHCFLPARGATLYTALQAAPVLDLRAVGGGGLNPWRMIR